MNRGKPLTPEEALTEAFVTADAAVSSGWPTDPEMARAILAALPEGWQLVHADTARPSEEMGRDSDYYDRMKYGDGYKPDTARPSDCAYCKCPMGRHYLGCTNPEIQYRVPDTRPVEPPRADAIDALIKAVEPHLKHKDWRDMGCAERIIAALASQPDIAARPNLEPTEAGDEPTGVSTAPHAPEGQSLGRDFTSVQAGGYELTPLRKPDIAAGVPTE